MKSLLAIPEREPIPEPPKEDYTAFLAELSKLSVKHGFFISGCGCCGSPYVYVEEDKHGEYTIDDDGDNLEWKN